MKLYSAFSGSSGMGLVVAALFQKTPGTRHIATDTIFINTNQPSIKKYYLFYKQ
jgi:hypothetical protein